MILENLFILVSRSNLQQALSQFYDNQRIRHKAAHWFSRTSNRTRTRNTRGHLIGCPASGDYPCLCLCFGFSQITLIRPFLLMILHFSHIGFTDDLTFTLNPPFKKDHFVL